MAIFSIGSGENRAIVCPIFSQNMIFEWWGRWDLLPTLSGDITRNLRFFCLRTGFNRPQTIRIETRKYEVCTKVESSKADDVLLKIYIGQNIRKEGILRSEIGEWEETRVLLSEGLIREEHWHLDQYLTTEKGNLLARGIINRKIEVNKGGLFQDMKAIPARVLCFFNKRYVSGNLAFSTDRSSFEIGGRFGSWQDSIVSDSHIWPLWNQFFQCLMSAGLCVKTFSYVSTRGGEKRDLHYVISPEVRDLLVHEFETSDFTPREEKTLGLYPFLTSAWRILAGPNIDEVRQRYYELLKTHFLPEDDVASIVNDMSSMKITSNYRGLSSGEKPFDIINDVSCRIYLSQNIVEPAVEKLLGERSATREYYAGKRMPSLDDTKTKFGILDDKEIGDFYIMLRNAELQLRDFIKEKLGKNWEKAIENSLQELHKEWLERKNEESRWGIEAGKELIDYANPGDYITIVQKHHKLFTNGEDREQIVAQLKTLIVHGRNPMMHFRTITQQKFYTAKSAVDFLSEWMKRKSIQSDSTNQIP